MIDRWTQFLNFIRGSVRPIVTYMVVGYLCAITWKVVDGFASEQMALLVVGAFIALVSSLSTYWFATREKSKP